jgi:hypothetical protein
MTSDAHPVEISGREDVEGLLPILGTDQNFKLSRIALATFLQRYIDGLISAENIFDLANVFEMNECINVSEPRDVAINDALFELANPAINGGLSRTRALTLVGILLQA